ncbi:PspA/IM30 family protein [Alienimonas sp. DA493]|uniref:PspA/IM30 family protein n=1 Tax=Alienimonas sp. DA493 TaxID=3373605 RepID=UPI003755196E
MPFFSRLTDIVTCSLSDLLADVDDPDAALAEIIAEMELGRAGAARSVATAADTAARLNREIAEQQAEADRWQAEAKKELAAGREAEARTALVRRREAADVIAGLRQELSSAEELHRHLQTTARALEARLNDAKRKRASLANGETPAADAPAPVEAAPAAAPPDDDIEHELAALRAELEA